MLIAFTTTGSREEAEALARVAIEHSHAVCAQVEGPITSVYRWQGAIERADEVLLLAKTWDDRLDALVATLRARHPYEVPEIMAVPAAGGLAAYLDWVREQTRPEGVDET